MENKDRTFTEYSELNYEIQNQSGTDHQRKILQYYVRNDPDPNKPKKSRTQTFSRPNMQSFLHLLNIKQQSLIFLNQDDLLTNITLFMQNSTYQYHQKFDTFYLQDSFIHILLDGTIKQMKQIVTKPSTTFLNIILNQDHLGDDLGENNKNDNINRNANCEGLKKYKSLNYQDQINSSNYRQARKSIIKTIRNSSQLSSNQIVVIQQEIQQPKKLRNNRNKSNQHIRLSHNSSNNINNYMGIPKKKTNFKPQLSSKKQHTSSPSTKPIIINNHSLISSDFTELVDKSYMYQVKSQQCIIISFMKSSLNKLIITIQQLQRQNLMKFISNCLCIDSPRLINKIIPRITKKKYLQKQQYNIDSKMIVMIYSGQLLLTKYNQDYRIYMRQYSVLWPKQQQKYKLQFTQDTYTINIQYYHLRNQYQQIYPQIIQNIKQKIRNNIKQRQQFFDININDDNNNKNYKQQQKQLETIYFTYNLQDKPLQSSQILINNLRAKPRTSKANAIKNIKKINQKNLMQKQQYQIKKGNNNNNNSNNIVKDYSKHSNQSNNLNNTILKVITTMDLSLSNFGHDYTERKNNLMNNPKVKSKNINIDDNDNSNNNNNHHKNNNSLSKQRFRVIQSAHHPTTTNNNNNNKSKYNKNDEQNKLFYQPQYNQFMSLYPFKKIIESQQIIRQRKKQINKKNKIKKQSTKKQMENNKNNNNCYHHNNNNNNNNKKKNNYTYNNSSKCIPNYNSNTSNNNIVNINKQNVIMNITMNSSNNNNNSSSNNNNDNNSNSNNNINNQIATTNNNNKTKQNPSTNTPFNTKAQKTLKQQQLRQKKRIFYNQKVRKLKIRNMASKQIPNGHRKIFDIDKAQKQIADNALINHMIQFPLEGQTPIKENNNSNSNNNNKKNSLMTQIKKKSLKYIQGKENRQNRQNRQRYQRNSDNAALNRKYIDQCQSNNNTISINNNINNNNSNNGNSTKLFNINCLNIISNNTKTKTKQKSAIQQRTTITSNLKRNTLQIRDNSLHHINKNNNDHINIMNNNINILNDKTNYPPKQRKVQSTIKSKNLLKRPQTFKPSKFTMNNISSLQVKCQRIKTQV